MTTTTSQASLYQQLRGHLATLKLPPPPSTCPACSTKPKPRTGR